MAVIKVAYNSISRRFNTTNWSDLESKLRSLYNIPNNTRITLSYKDEDDDIITLSSDLEFKEVLAQQSTGKPIKLVLNTTNNNENLIFEEEDNNIVVVDENQTVEIENEENVESRYKHASVSEEEEEEEEIVVEEKEEEKEKDNQSAPLDKEKETETEKQQEKQEKDNENDEDDEDDGIIFIISYPLIRPSFFGPRFGLFGNPRFNGYCPFNFYERPRYYRPSYFNEYSSPFAYSCQYGPNTCGNSSKPYYCPKYKNSEAEASTSASASTSTSASTSEAAQSAKKNRCDNNRSSCFNYPRYYNYYNQKPLTQEQLNDKLSTLHSMGFDSSHNSLYEDLLKRYNGNLDRVVELLLRNQQVNEHYDNDSVSANEPRKKNGIVINEEKSRRVNSEEDKPYVL